MTGISLTEWSAGARAGLRVAVSDTAADQVRRHYRLRTDAVIPNGVDTAVFAPRPKHASRVALGLPEDGRVALYVGRLEHGKGVDLLTPVCSEAGWTLAAAGAVAPAGSFALGMLDPQRLALAYSAADCLLFPTRYEGCSYVILEAIACGLPLLTTRTGWIPTLLREVPEYAQLILPHDLGAFASALKTFDDHGAQQLAAAARELVIRDNSLAKFTERWREVLSV